MSTETAMPDPAGVPDGGAPRVGVFVCECGDRIAGPLDVDALVESAGEIGEVVHAAHAPYWCSADGQAAIEEAVLSAGIDRFVIAGCSLRTHRPLFRKVAANAGLDPELVGIVNVREGCAYPHRDEPEGAAARAREQICMEVSHVVATNPAAPVGVDIERSALVLGGGVAGLTAALEISGAGIPVTLVERGDALGGRALEDAPELSASLVSAVEATSKVTVLTGRRAGAFGGTIGGYRATLEATGNGADPVEMGPFGTVVVATGEPDDDTVALSEALHLPRDVRGGLTEMRVRLRPERSLERGIYVCGSVHFPCDASRAQFQGFSAASRALRHLGRGSASLRGPRAEVTDHKCNGCSDCAPLCPFSAITMVERPSGTSLSIVDPVKCTGCGNCVSVCPVSAMNLTGWTDAQLEAQIAAALEGSTIGGNGGDPRNDSRVLVFACEWSGHAAAELAGAQLRTYPAGVRMIRLDCTGRLQAGFIMSAFERGAAGVLVMGCAPKLCHYERGNERAAAACAQAEDLTRMIGVHPSRLKLEWTPPDDGEALANLLTDFVREAREAMPRVQ